MKCADLGHCCKPWRMHRKWAFRIMEEMYQQGDAERELGNTSVFEAMDRQKIDRAAKSQVGEGGGGGVAPIVCVLPS